MLFMMPSLVSFLYLRVIDFLLRAARRVRCSIEVSDALMGRFYGDDAFGHGRFLLVKSELHAVPDEANEMLNRSFLELSVAR